MILRIKYPFFIFGCILCTLFFDSSGIIGHCIAAVILHESGHIFFYKLLLRQKPVVHISAGGIALQWASLSAHLSKEICILLAGPVANFLAAGATAVAAQQTARLGLWFFCGVNFLMGLFNLLPLSFLDGGRLLEICLQMFLAPPSVIVLCRALQWMCLAALSGYVFLSDASITTKFGLLCFMVYFCIKSFCVKN